METRKAGNSGDLLSADAVESVEGLELRAKSIVEGFIAGLHKSPHHGFSVEFTQHKQYYPGDEIRKIDWRVFGRTDRYFIKQYEEETNTGVFIVLDSSASMAYRQSGTESKFHYAVHLASALAYLGLGQNDAIGLALAAEKVDRFLPPSSKDVQFKNIISLLSATRASGKTDLERVLSQVSRQIKRRSIVIVLSDLLDGYESVRKALDDLKFSGNEVILFHILDPSELSFPFNNMVKFVDLETGVELTADTVAVAEAYRRKMDEYLSALKAYSNRSGVDHQLMTTDKAFDEALRNYLVRRMKFTSIRG